MQGISFKDLVFGRKPDTVREASFYHFYSSSCPKHIGIRTKDHKMLVYLGKKNGDILGYDLYDLVNDPFEMNSVYDDPAYSGVAEMMQARLDEEMTAIGFSGGLYPGKDQKNIDRRVVVQLTDPEGDIIYGGNIRFNDSIDHLITENGYVSIFNVFPGTYAMRAEADGYDPYSGSVTIESRANYKEANDTLISLPLSAVLYKLNITVSDLHGPLSGASVTVNEQGYTTDGTGMAEAGGLSNGEYPVAVEAAGYDSIRDTITIADADVSTEYVMTEISTGLHSWDTQPKIYPNPASGEFTVEGGDPGSMLRMINSQGMPVRETEIDSPHAGVSMQGLPAGIYTLSMEGIIFTIIHNGD